MAGFPEDIYGIQAQDLHVKTNQHFIAAQDLRYMSNLPHGYSDVRRGFIDNLHGLPSRPDFAAESLHRGNSAANGHEMLSSSSRDLPSSVVGSPHDFQQRINRNLVAHEPPGQQNVTRLAFDHALSMMQHGIASDMSRYHTMENIIRPDTLPNSCPRKLPQHKELHTAIQPASETVSILHNSSDVDRSLGSRSGSQTSAVNSSQELGLCSTEGSHGFRYEDGLTESTSAGGRPATAGAPVVNNEEKFRINSNLVEGRSQISVPSRQETIPRLEDQQPVQQQQQKDEYKEFYDDNDDDMTSDSDLGEMICVEPELGYIKPDTDNDDSKISANDDKSADNTENSDDTNKEPASFKCIECSLYFSKKNAMYLHKRNCHNPKYLCDLCDFATSEVSSLKKHRLSVHEKVRYPCDACSFQASCTTVLKEHKLTQHVKIKHPCNLCSFVTYGKRNLKRHMMKMHQVCLQTQALQCEECEFTTSYAFCLKEHKETHHDGKKFACDFEQCQFKTLLRKELIDHKVEAHQGRMTEVKHYPCTQCDYVGSTMGNLNTHIRSLHDGLKPVKQFACDRCDYVGTFKCNLNSHIRSQHEGVRPNKSFPCDQCTYVATYKSNLKAHIKTRHQGIKSDKVFPCPKCQYVSSYKSNLNSHIKSQHEGIKSTKAFPCDQCDYVGSYKCNLNEHKKRKHGQARIEISKGSKPQSINHDLPVVQR